MAGSRALHAAVPVMFWVVPSLKVAIAWSWKLPPKTMDNVAGMMFRAVTAGGLTVTFADPVTDPEVALIVTAPVALAITLPAELTLAIAADELHVAD